MVEDFKSPTIGFRIANPKELSGGLVEARSFDQWDDLKSLSRMLTLVH